MSKSEDTKKKPESQQKDDKKSNVVELDKNASGGLIPLENPDHTFDTDQINDFIDLVFQDNVPEDAHRLVYATTNTSYGPGMPISAGVDYLTTKILRGRKGKALYFNIASTYPDNLGVLRHKRDLFAALHVLVLDDIGTKIPLEDVPEELEPTYIIESSEGNYQYGYVFDEPVTNLDHATALVQTLALAELTDKGGVMATKIVRLPDGINGKDDPLKRDFKVKLTKDDGPYWTPEAFLDNLNFELDGHKVTWESILDNEYSPIDRKHRTEFMPLRPIAQTADGVVDPVLEWLYANDMVVGDSGRDWVDIECPWGHEHSTGSTTAGYSPVGRGEGKNTNIRAFHCFHEHCADKKTPSFLEHILYNSDLRAIPIFDPTGVLFSNYVFDSVNNRVWRCGDGNTLAQNIDGFKTEYNNHTSALVVGKGGKVEYRSMTAAQLWLTSPYRTVVAGAVHDPSGEALVKDEYGTLWANTYRQVKWGSGDYDQAHIDKFKDFIKYLLPDERERDYFMDWIAAKVQDPYFRGTGIVMVAESFGVGRSTLGNMLSDMLGSYNSANVPFDELLSPKTYNHWEDKQLVVVSEAKETAAISESRGAYRAYEALKQRIDTTVGETMLNLKFQPHKLVKVCCSYLVLTNHTNAVAVPEHDRRLTVLRNPDKPAGIGFFKELNAWINEKDARGRSVWAKHVYRWLREYEVKDYDSLMLPLPTIAKQQMSEQGLHGPARVIKIASDICFNNGIYYIGSGQLTGLVNDVLYGMGDPRAGEYKEEFVRNCMNDETICYANWKQRPGSSSTSLQRVRVFKRPLLEGAIPEYDGNYGKYTSNADLPPEMLTKGKLDVKTVEATKNEIVAEIIKRLKEAT